MVRARLAFSALAGSLLLTCGCVTTQQSECANSGCFNRYRLASRATPAPCECEGGVPMTHGDGAVMMPPNAFVPPNAFTPPNTFTPPNSFVPPGAIATPPPMIMTNPPGGPQAPRIVPIPQASPVPYTPQ